MDKLGTDNMRAWVWMTRSFPNGNATPNSKATEH